MAKLNVKLHKNIFCQKCDDNFCVQQTYNFCLEYINKIGTC